MEDQLSQVSLGNSHDAKVTLVLPKAERPPPWKDLARCLNCGNPFTLIRRHHHCRNCGGDFCADCASKFTTIPKYGWIVSDVRVCDRCYTVVEKEKQEWKKQHLGVDENGTVGKSRVVDPPRWIHSKSCMKCSKEFTQTLRDHHCRNCGLNFCGACANHFCAIPKYGWFLTQVRVCDQCYVELYASGQTNINIVQTPTPTETLSSSTSTSSDYVSFSSGVLSDED